MIDKLIVEGGSMYTYRANFVVLNFLVFMCGCVILRNTQGPFYITLNCATYDMATLCIASDCVICKC